MTTSRSGSSRARPACPSRRVHAVKVIFRDFLDTGATLELTFRDLDDEATRGRLRKTFHFLISSFVRQPEISLLHLPSETVFKPFWWKETVE
jgi:hypothetical protein